MGSWGPGPSPCSAHAPSPRGAAKRSRGLFSSRSPVSSVAGPHGADTHLWLSSQDPLHPRPRSWEGGMTPAPSGQGHLQLAPVCGEPDGSSGRTRFSLSLDPQHQPTSSSARKGGSLEAAGKLAVRGVSVCNVAMSRGLPRAVVTVLLSHLESELSPSISRAGAPCSHQPSPWTGLQGSGWVAPRLPPSSLAGLRAHSGSVSRSPVCWRPGSGKRDGAAPPAATASGAGQVYGSLICTQDGPARQVR